jgi:hypothetical protein
MAKKIGIQCQGQRKTMTCHKNAEIDETAETEIIEQTSPTENIINLLFSC